MKPKPLNFENLFSKEEMLKAMEKIRLEGHSFPHGDICRTCEDDFLEVKEFVLDKIKQQLKQACEFYLNYKDDPFSFKDDFPSLRKEVEEIIDRNLELPEHEGWSLYNEWLFKLTFKEVLGGDTK